MLGLAAGPNLVTGRWSYGGGLLAMFGPDPFWTNQSINGWLSRLALPSQGVPPPLPGLPVTPLMVLACAALGSLALAVAARPGASWRGTFALLLCYAVVAAPKNSLWNFAPLVVVLVHTWTLVRGRPAPLAALALAWTLIDGQVVANALRAQAAAGAWLASLALYGALLLGGLLGWALLRARAHEHDDLHA